MTHYINVNNDIIYDGLYITVEARRQQNGMSKVQEKKLSFKNEVEIKIFFKKVISGRSALQEMLKEL